jgi:hypothetical protein
MRIVACELDLCQEKGEKMATLEMKGSYELTTAKINAEVTRTSPGNYALGYRSEDTFIVEYVGRSDTDVAARLKQHVGEKYARFKYSYATSAKAAFEKECRNYHDFGGKDKLDNSIHPDRPANSGWKCPCCKIFD